MQTRLRLHLCLSKASLALLSLLLLLGACSDDAIEPQPADNDPVPPPSAFEVLNPEFITSATEIALDYVEQIGVDFERVETDIVALQSAIEAFIARSSTENLVLAQQAWLTAHSSYELTTLHRYFAAQLFDDQTSLELLELQYRIGHWPIIPGYIDYVEGYPDSGIVHDINVSLDEQNIREQHGSFDVSEVVLGFHVIEFLLWGSDSETRTRPVADYQAIEVLSPEQLEGGYALDQLSNNRRRVLLTLISDALLSDFRSLQALWQNELEDIRQSIEMTTAPEIIVILADSMAAMLSEELLLRSLYPMLNGDYVESIQSPFSLSTQNDVSTQLSALEGLLLERQTEDGTTLDLVFSAVSDGFSEFFYQNFDASKSCLVLLYSNLDSGTEIADPTNQSEIEIVECINLLTNMVDHLERLKLELTN